MLFLAVLFSLFVLYCTNSFSINEYNNSRIKKEVIKINPFNPIPHCKPFVDTTYLHNKCEPAWADQRERCNQRRRRNCNCTCPPRSPGETCIERCLSNLRGCLSACRGDRSCEDFCLRQFDGCRQQC